MLLRGSRITRDSSGVGSRDIPANGRSRSPVLDELLELRPIVLAPVIENANTAAGCGGPGVTPQLVVLALLLLRARAAAGKTRGSA